MKKILCLSLLTTALIWSDFHLQVKSIQNGSEYLLDSGDIVFSGDTLRFSFHSDTASTLKIFSDDNKIVLHTQILTKNTNYVFPEKGKELKLDDNIGIETFTFKLNNKKVKTFILHHVSKNIPKKIKTDTKERNTTETINFPTFGNRKYTDQSSIKSNSRNATDKRVFKELSTPTVIVKSGDELGAGVVIDTKGHILTNWHLIQKQDLAYIAFKPRIGNKPNKSNYYSAQVIKSDPKKDLTLLQLLNNEIVEDKNINPISLSGMKNPEVGEDIYTIGHPRGYYYNLTSGIVGSILNDHTWKAKGIQHKAKCIIKTQNQISDGNSGGPLVNKDLELLGLMTYSDTKGQNLNFAVSIEDIQDFLNAKQSPQIHTAIVTPHNTLKETAFRTKPTRAITSDITYNVVDRKGNPIIIQRLDSNGNGKADIIMIDTDKDGQWDKIGYDRDEDGIIEKWNSY